MTHSIPAGHRIGRPERPMHAPELTRSERFGGLAGKLLYIFGAHLPVVGRLNDRRIELLLRDVEELLDRELPKEAIR